MSVYGLDVTKPYLYKYKPIDKYLLAMLLNNELYFASPDQLNDPLDCRISVVESIKHAHANAINDEQRKWLDRVAAMPEWEEKDELTKKIGIFSLSKTPLSACMWSHYADSHQGVCLGFKLPFDWMDEDHTDINIMGDVEYSNENRFIAILTNGYDIAVKLSVNTRPPVLCNINWWQGISYGYMTKGKDWEYEEEYRLLRPTNGNVAFDPSYLHEIIFGMEVTDEDKALILQILSQGGYSDVTVKHVHKDIERCGIRIVED